MREVDTFANTSSFEVQVHEARRARIAHEADHVARTKARSDGVLQKARRGRFEMRKEENVVAKDTSLSNRMACHDGRAEEGPDVDELGVLLLVVEGYQRDGRSPRGREIDAAMTDVAQATSAPLL